MTQSSSCLAPEAATPHLAFGYNECKSAQNSFLVSEVLHVQIISGTSFLVVVAVVTIGVSQKTKKSIEDSLTENVVLQRCDNTRSHHLHFTMAK